MNKIKNPWLHKPGYNFLLVTLCSLSVTTGFAQKYDMKLTVDLQSHEAYIPKSLYGVFFEEINHAGEGGLCGELLQNRSLEDQVMPMGYHVENGSLVPFEAVNYATGRVHHPSYRWTEEPYPGWEIRLADHRCSQDDTQGEDAVYAASVLTDQPNFVTAPSFLRLDIKQWGRGLSLVNKGFWGIHYEQDEAYRVRLWVRCKADREDASLRLCLANPEDTGAHGSADICLINDGQWHEYKAVIHATGDAKAGELYLNPNATGVFDFDYVSLFPVDTYRNRENGMRRDVAEMIEQLRPAFVRWPGGCVVEGITLNNRLDWKKTLGDPAARPGECDSWGYRNSYGFGYKEFLDFCEDLGAKGMFVCNVGMACTGRTGEYSAEGDIQFYIDDVLQAIEYAIGDTTTVWGAVRAREGHPAPYPLAYVEIGNENFGPIYDHRYQLFHDAIAARYPQLQLISNYGLEGVGKTLGNDMIDPHWYVKPERFFSDTHQFDSYDRQGPKVYIGEYSCNDGVGTGCMLAALSEAAFLTGVERNADVVRMASYAPLFEHEHDRAWPVNLIWISSDQVVGRSSYYVQQLFAQNRPTYNLHVDSQIKAEKQRQAFLDQDSYFGLGAIDTQAQFRNVSIRRGRETIMLDDPSAAKHWQPYDDEHRHALIWRDGQLKEGDIVEFDAWTEGGREQFTLFFDLKRLDLQEGGRMITFGGWDNSATGVEGFYGESSRWTTVSQQPSSAIAPRQWHHVRASFLADGLTIQLDGTDIFTHRTDIRQRKFYAAGYDSTTDEIIIKLVNANPRRCTAHIDLQGAKVERKGMMTELRADSPLDENDYEHPKRIKPVERQFNGFASSFNYTMPANSLTILRCKVLR